MKFKDELRFILSKAQLKKTILFSKQDDWEWYIKNTIRNYVPFFYELDEVGPDRFDLIVPLTLRAAKHLNTHFEYLKGTKALAPSNETIDLCDNKKDFAEFLIKNGFPHLIPQINGDGGYPYILRKKIGAWGEGVTVIANAKTELMHMGEIRSNDFFAQQYIEGREEYTTHLIMHQNRVLFSKTFEFTFGERLFVKGKNYKPISTKVVDHSHLNALFEAILNLLRYEGICCLNYKVQGNRVKLFEINPRYGGSMTNCLNEALATYSDIMNNHIDRPLQSVASQCDLPRILNRSAKPRL